MTQLMATEPVLNATASDAQVAATAVQAAGDDAEQTVSSVVVQVEGDRDSEMGVGPSGTQTPGGGGPVVQVRSRMA